MNKTFSKAKLLFVLLAVAVAAVTFTGCPGGAESGDTSYTVKFETDGGTEIESRTVPSGSKATFPEIIPQKEGFIFAGWFADQECTIEFDFEIPIKINLTLYAKWVEGYTVSFVSEDGETLAPSLVVAKDSLVQLPEPLYKEGFVFGGWYTDKALENIFVLETPIIENLVLYAKFVSIEDAVTITFETNGGSEIVPVTYKKGDIITKPADPKKEGYAFIGWFEHEELTSRYTSFGIAEASYSFTLYAKWGVACEVTFVTNGDTPDWKETVAEGEYLDRPAENPSKKGYVFEGWYTDEECSLSYNFTESVTSDFILYAKWKSATYFVIFNSGEQNVWVPGRLVNYLEKVSEPETPVTSYYDFVGWYSDKECTIKFDFNTLIESDTTLYAKWSPKKFTVSFDSNGGSTVEPIPVTYYSKATAPAIPTKTGYDFEGWYSDSGLLNKYDFNDSVIKSDIKLYAKWKTQVLSIRFDGNGGEIVGAIAWTIPYNQVPVSDIPTATKENCAFKGWYSNLESTTAYDFTAPVTQSITLYAKWEIDGFRVEFETNGYQSFPWKAVKSGERVAEPVFIVSREGYTLRGWYTDSDFNNIWNFNTPVTGNMKLYARWIINKYTVTFESNCGVTISSQNIEYQQKVSAPATTLTKTGYRFAGWYSNSECTQAFNFATTPITSNTNLYAKWVKLYTVSFVPNNGDDIDSQTIDENTKVTIPDNLEKDGYTFIGWFTDSTFTTSFDINTPVTGENTQITLYAKWDIKKYTVNFQCNGGSTIDSQTVNYNEKVTKPQNNPTKDDFDFVDWYSDAACTTRFNFNSRLTGDSTKPITVYAKWKPVNAPYNVTIVLQMGNDITLDRYENNDGTTTFSYTYTGKWYLDGELIYEDSSWEFDPEDYGPGIYTLEFVTNNPGQSNIYYSYTATIEVE